jgi:hypothetical protein
VVGAGANGGLLESLEHQDWKAGTVARCPGRHPGQRSN